MSIQNRDIYPRSRTPELDQMLFQNPPSEYRGAPLWSWNNRLEKGQLFRQIEALKEMGFGGFHMHPRTGLDTEYLGAEFMEMVRACTAKAKEEGMLAWLYDEDRWPSGFAGGHVTKHPQHRAKRLLWTTTPYGDTPPTGFNVYHVLNHPLEKPARTENGILLARFAVGLEDGYLSNYRRLAEGELASLGTTEWFAYLETAPLVTWFNNFTYLDTLSPDSVRAFIESTYERYAQSVGGEFGVTVPAIFTDEPQFTHMSYLPTAESRADVICPFAADFFETYHEAYGQSLRDALPELFWELPADGKSLVRYRYFDHLSERFAAAYADTIGGWCDEHGIAFTGHLMDELTLESQTAAVGDAMRSYRSFHIPGIDILDDAPEYTTAKQALSAARQFGRGAMLSELYGVTNWTYDFASHKAQGDWQAALGVTVRVPHLAWVSMAGEAKRDYPASIGPQSPWYREYPLVEDYFARLNTVLTRGRPRVRVGVIHPIESFWLACGPLDQTHGEREERDAAFKNLTEWLLFGLIDFDFISESLLPTQNPHSADGKLRVGEMGYDVIIVPGLKTIRAITLQYLEGFVEGGGQVIFAGAVPDLIDAEPAGRASELAARCTHIALSRPSLLGALEPYRDLSVTLPDGAPATTLLYQLRDDESPSARALFLCNTDREAPVTDAKVRIPGEWSLTVLDTLDGTRAPLASAFDGADTVFRHTFEPGGSLLLELRSGWREVAVSAPTGAWREVQRLYDPVPVTLSEPNVLLLDQAAYRWNDEPWKGSEEILRICNIVRGRVNLPAITWEIAQPWTDAAEAPVLGRLDLKFQIISEVALAAPQLALENAAAIEIFLNGEAVPNAVTGYFVDEAIQAVALPSLEAGRHELILRIAFTRKTSLEWCYLLGDFGVHLQGRHATLTAPVRELAFGDWTRQGLPFYAGNVTYHCALSTDDTESEIALCAPHFKAPLLSVDLDGGSCAKIAFAPYRASLGRPARGQHALDITAFGDRFNAFGCLHHTAEKLAWVGPEKWRTEGAEWTYGYRLCPMGILDAPMELKRDERTAEIPE